jgi:ABC-type nitrate/sulfonate/bicarbonate transport system substrate-binding protein
MLTLAICASCDHPSSKAQTAQKLEKLNLGTSDTILSSLIWIAKERGYFSKQGLDINFKLYESGHLAVKDLLAGHLDLVTATEFATVRAFMQRPDLRIISALDRADDQQLIARKDSAIKQIANLRGKRIGLTKSSSAEYYLHLLLILHAVPWQEVHVVNLLPSKQIKALANGDVDAVMSWEPFATTAKKQLGPNAVSWPGQSELKEYWLLVSTSEVIGKRSRALRLFLTAVMKAEDFIKNNDVKARQIMASKLPGIFNNSLWRNHRFGLDLDRPLVLKMEAEITWLKARHKANISKIPDVLELIYFDGLKSVRPEKIKMLH